MLFCGEATSADYYSTVHGAAFSGQREATRLKVALGLEVEEEAAATKKSVWASPDITRPAAAPTVWRPGRTGLDADVAREDGALAAITFGRREMEIPDKKPPRDGVLPFPGSDTLDDISYRNRVAPPEGDNIK